jgi:acetyl-CoA synthetase
MSNATSADNAGERAAYTWKPTAERVEQANVTRLARAHGIDAIDALRAASVADIGWFWDAVVKDLDLSFRQPYDPSGSWVAGSTWSTPA